MNMQNIMAQAQKMQKEIESAKKQIDSSIFQGHSEWVDVEITGKKKIKKLTITRNGTIDEEDKEMLEDMIMIAINDAFTQIDKMTQEKMGKYGSALNGIL